MTDEDRLAGAREQAKAQYDHIKELVEALLASRDDDDRDAQARQAIEESALSVQVRSGWGPVKSDMEPTKYCILLCTGGPAVRIIGDLSHWLEPVSATLQCQDWFTPWTEAMADVREGVLLEYVSCFYFGG